MPQLSLTYATLGAINGGAAEAIIDRAIDDALRDAEDRGQDEKPRKVVIELTLVQQENGLVEASVTAAAKLPPRKTAPTVARLKKHANGAALLFQEHDSADPDQETLPFDHESEAK